MQYKVDPTDQAIFEKNCSLSINYYYCSDSMGPAPTKSQVQNSEKPNAEKVEVVSQFAV